MKSIQKRAKGGLSLLLAITIAVSLLCGNALAEEQSKPIEQKSLTTTENSTGSTGQKISENKKYCLTGKIKNIDLSDDFLASSSIRPFSTNSYNGCFGNQLKGLSLNLYHAYVSYYVINKNIGNCKCTLTKPLRFNAQIRNGELVENKSLLKQEKLLNQAMQNASVAFLMDYPEVFWMVPGNYSCMPSVSRTTNIGRISKVTIRPDEIYVGASKKVSAYNRSVKEMVKRIKKHLGSATGRYYVLKYIHNYICNQAYYTTSSEIKVHTSEPFFLGDKGIVCNGYATTLKVLCDQFKIPCTCVVGLVKTTSGDMGGHMWNYVQMENKKWYLVDATWDDQEKSDSFTQPQDG